MTYFTFCRQILITTADFYSDEIKQNLFETMQELISLNIVPIINTNDAVAPPPQIDEDLAGVSCPRSTLLHSFHSTLTLRHQSDLA